MSHKTFSNDIHHIGETITVINQATPSKTWSCQIFSNVFYVPEQGKEPSWFHRKMQEWVFGVKWIKTS